MAILTNAYINGDLKVTGRCKGNLVGNVTGSASRTNAMMTSRGNENVPAYMTSQGVPQLCTYLDNVRNYDTTSTATSTNIAYGMQTNSIVWEIDAFIGANAGLIINSYSCYGFAYPSLVTGGQPRYDYTTDYPDYSNNEIALNEVIGITTGNILHPIHQAASDIIINLGWMSGSAETMALYAFDINRIVGTRKRVVINNTMSYLRRIRVINGQNQTNYLITNGMKTTLTNDQYVELYVESDCAKMFTVFLPSSDTTCLIFDA